MAQNDTMTTLGTDAKFKGELEFEKGVRLLGSFEGEIKSKGELLIAEGANLSGEVNAGSINIDGDVRGNLKAGAKVVLSATGHLEGDICATRLEVADGAVLIGRCVVGVDANGKPNKNNKPAAPAAATNNNGAANLAAAAPVKK